MKLVAFMLAFISVSYALKDPCRGDHLDEVYKQCLAKNGGDIVVIEDLMQFKEASNENSKCFRDCIMRECKYFGDDGKLNPDVPQRLAAMLYDGNDSNLKPIEDAVTKCMERQTYGVSKCENAEVFSKCVLQIPAIRDDKSSRTKN